MVDDTTKAEGKDEAKGLASEVKSALEAPAFVFGGYREREDYTPDPFFQSGQVDTSDTSGTANNSIKEVSPIFEVARVQNLRDAARALDPDDDSVPAELVTLPQGQVTVMGTTKSAEEGRDEVLNAVLKAAENPPEVGGMSPAQKLAAEDTSDEGKSEGKRYSIKGDDTVGHTKDSYERQRTANEARAAEEKKTEGKTGDAQSTPKVESK